MENKKQKAQRTGLAVTVCILTAALFALAVYTAVLKKTARKEHALLAGRYDCTLADMTSAVRESEEYLLKAMAAGTARKTAEMLQEAARTSSYAEGCMAQLPLDAQISAKVSNYLVQVNDLAKAWAGDCCSGDDGNGSSGGNGSSSDDGNGDGGNGGSGEDGRAAADWQGLGDDRYRTLESLHGYAADLGGLLSELAARVAQNKKGWDAIEQDARELMEDPFSDYPALEYDGKFAEHMKHRTPKDLCGAEISPEEGAEAVRKLFTETFAAISGRRYGADVHFTAENEQNGIQIYSYEVALTCDGAQETAYVDLTRLGGIPCAMTRNRAVENVQLSDAQCAEAGLAFLKAIGLRSMEAVEMHEGGGYTTVTYAYVQDGVLCYPDSVRVRVAGDTGEPLAFEARSYLLCHCARDFGARTADGSAAASVAASVSQERARSRISARLEVESVRECVLDNGYGGEWHAYEFRCTGLGHTFRIAVDADSGQELAIEIVE